MFNGWSLHNLDVKGRVAISVRFRDVLKARGDGRLVITTSSECLAAYPMDEWRKVTEKLSGLSQFDPRVQDFKRFFISGAEEVAPDKQGRVLIPQALRDMAGLEAKGQVLLVGMQSFFEIWEKERWDAKRKAIQANFGDLSAFVAELGV